LTQLGRAYQRFDLFFKDKNKNKEWL
jgi:hypothetical protein